MPYSVSPLETVYLEEPDFLAVDFEDDDFFWVVPLETLFLGAEDELEAVFFGVPKAYGSAGGSG